MRVANILFLVYCQFWKKQENYYLSPRKDNNKTVDLALISRDNSYVGNKYLDIMAVQNGEK